MDFEAWRKAVDNELVANKSALTIDDIDEDRSLSAFQSGVAPAEFARSALPAVRPGVGRRSDRKTAIAMAVTFDVFGIVSWLGAIISTIVVAGRAGNTVGALVAVSQWFYGGAVMFFLGIVVRLLVSIEENTSH
ncbi:MAG: hypothetical protein JST30_16325 [Armatimonadetes bacterium]|nr:hypothetical protein [Armatimonadota bacterium]